MILLILFSVYFTQASEEFIIAPELSAAQQLLFVEGSSRNPNIFQWFDSFNIKDIHTLACVDKCLQYLITTARKKVKALVQEKSDPQAL